MAMRMVRRLVALGALLIVVVALPIPASAAPSNSPTAITITGPGLVEPLIVRPEDDPELFAAVHSQVNWLTGRGQSGAPRAETLGPKYSVVVHVGESARHSYDLYPLARGGPRAYRPATQPGKRKTTAAWFYGRLNMPEALHAAGVPLPTPSGTVITGVGGIGGGTRMIPENALDPAEEIDRMLTDLRRLMLLNAAVLLTITVGLACATVLLHRRNR